MELGINKQSNILNYLFNQDLMNHNGLIDGLCFDYYSYLII
jgi:hypothetical protein